jgi:hypothetical protein
MMEYRVEILGGTIRAAKPHELEALLNRVAEERWALCELSYKPNSNQLWVILERESEVDRPRSPRKSWLADWA